jgi:hypothetical protein
MHIGLNKIKNTRSISDLENNDKKILLNIFSTIIIKHLILQDVCYSRL